MSLFFSFCNSAVVCLRWTMWGIVGAWLEMLSSLTCHSAWPECHSLDHVRRHCQVFFLPLAAIQILLFFSVPLPPDEILLTRRLSVISWSKPSRKPRHTWVFCVFFCMRCIHLEVCYVRLDFSKQHGITGVWKIVKMIVYTILDNYITLTNYCLFR